MINLIRVDSFIDNINREGCFDTQDMDGVSLNYRIVFASKLPSGITSVNDCLDAEGTLKDEVELIDAGDDGLIALEWHKGINGDRYLTTGTSSIVVDLGDVNIDVAAIFLVDNSTGFVMAYNIDDKGIHFTKDQAVFPLQGIVWNIYNGVER